MGRGAVVEQVATDLVRAMARRHEVAGRVEAMLDLVSAVVGASAGLVVRSDPTHTVVEVLSGQLVAPDGEALSHQLQRMPEGDPLLGPVSAGDLTPRTAEREFGEGVWGASIQRRGCLRYCGVDQVCTLPLVGGPDFVVVFLGRVGPDFEGRHLDLLAQIRPLVADVVALAGLRPLTVRTAPPRLTSREHEVLRLLAAGHTCSQMARELGASPRTVEVHLGRIYDKLGVRDRLSAVLTAYDLQVLPPRPAPA